MGILHAVFSSIKNIEHCIVSSSREAMSISATTLQYTVYATVPIKANGRSTPQVYPVQELLHASKNASSIEEKESTLAFFQESTNISIKRTVFAIHSSLSVPPPPSEHTSKVFLSVGVFKKAVSLLKDTTSFIYLSNGTLVFSTDTTDGENILKVLPAYISKEGTEKVCIHTAALKLPNSLLSKCEQILLSYTSAYLSLLLIFTKDVAQYNVIAHGVHTE
ncbi:hypothetical protein NECID01_1784 [Nematocida sp. AWRm77]|nr:hypothetical protein NECID01_1784 [Nematocida sp. AWRm77]